jgi:HlyD family secretion protein
MNSIATDKPTPAPVKQNNRPRRRWRWLPYIGAVLLLAAIAAGLWPQPAPVELARASIGLLRATVDEEGKTRIKERFLISAPTIGQLRRIPFKAGATVHAGETVLAIIDPPPPAPLDARSRALAEAARDTAAANLEKARVTHDFAANELKRFQKLYADQTVSIQDLEAAQAREAAAAKELSASESALRQAEAQLANFFSNNSATNSLRSAIELKAPISGQVLHIFEENTRLVGAGTPLLEVGDPANLEVVIETLSRDGATIAPGTKVEMEQWGGGQPLLGRVRLVEPAAFTKVSALGVEEQRVNVIADLVTPPDQRLALGDNFRVEARIIVWETNQALKVPSGALFRHGPEWAAFVVSNGRAHLRSIKAGRTSGTETQVLEGLKDGEEVILYPGDRIRDGQRVKPIKI